MSPWLIPAPSRMVELWVSPQGNPGLRKVKGSFTTDFNGMKISPNWITKATASLTEIQN